MGHAKTRLSLAGKSAGIRLCAVRFCRSSPNLCIISFSAWKDFCSGQTTEE
jgi:hypothetical protein